MAETSSAAFNCAAKSWNASQSSSALSELLTELKSSNAKPPVALANNKPIKNGNGVDAPHLNLQSNSRDESEKHSLSLKRKLSSATSPASDSVAPAPNHHHHHSTNDAGSQASPAFQPVKQNNGTNNGSPASHYNPVGQLNDRINDRPPVSVKSAAAAAAAADGYNPNECGEQPKTGESSDFVRRDDIRFAVGFKLEACDATGTWYPAKVVAINEKENQVLIHFIRWSKKFDEWMAMDSDSLRAFTKENNDDENGDSDPQKSFTTGKLVLATWSDTKKYPGTIQGITSDGNFNILFLDGYRKKVKRSLIEPLPADYQLNFSSPIGECFWHFVRFVFWLEESLD